jgi:hypothetical protein
MLLDAYVCIKLANFGQISVTVPVLMDPVPQDLWTGSVFRNGQSAIDSDGAGGTICYDSLSRYTSLAGLSIIVSTVLLTLLAFYYVRYYLT